MAAASGARSALVNECPASCIGALLTMLLQQVSYDLTWVGFAGTANSARLAIASSIIGACQSLVVLHSAPIRPPFSLVR